MRITLLLLSLSACAGPSTHLERVPQSALVAPALGTRPAVSTVLDADEPLDAPACAAGGAIAPCPKAAPMPEMHHHHHQAQPAATEAVDPICGMKVNPATAQSVTLGGRTVSFCSQTCKLAYLARHGDGGTP